MKQAVPSRLILMLVILVVVLACRTSDSAPDEPSSEAPTPTTSVLDTPASPLLTAEPSIQHQMTPGDLPQERSGQAGDQDSSLTAEQKKSNGGDRFAFEQFERPFNANTMDVYFPNIDIIDTFVYQDDTWIYGTVKVVDRAAVTTVPFRFAMQLDIQVDGRGDWLVIASNPLSTEWTTDGVQVFFDANRDVGGSTPLITDKNVQSDGFESMVFDQGKGDDADAAWVRVSPSDPNTVELAVKRSLLGSPPLYLINMWAGNNGLDQSMFDYNDHYTHEQAGAADPGFPIFYPIKAVYELDNSCRIAVGFQPRGTEPGLCQSAIPDAPDEPEVAPSSPGASCIDYGGSCGSGSSCCNGVPCTGGICRYP